MKTAGERIFIVPEKLDYELHKRGLTKGMAGKRLGYSEQYFSNVTKRGWILRPGMEMLKSVYSITEEDIAIPQEVEAPAAMQFEDLLEAVKFAVRQTLIEYFEEN